MKLFNSSNRRITLGIGAIKTFQAIISFLSVVYSSKYFGTSIYRDAWVLALSLIMFVGTVIFGPMNGTFRAKYLLIKGEENDNIALHKTRNLVTFCSIVSLGIIVIFEFYPELLSNIFAPGYNSNDKNILNLMIRLVLPNLLITQLIQIWTAVLNVYKSFYIPEILAVLSSIINLLFIILIAPYIGIISLILATYVNNIILGIVLVRKISSLEIDVLKFCKIKIKYIIPFFTFSLPLYFNYFFSQSSTVIEKSLSTKMGVGNVSAIDYARRFIDMPSGVITSTIATILVPTLTSYFITHKNELFIDELNKFLRMLLIIFLPVFFVFLICSKECVELVLLRGSFDKKFLIPTSEALFWFSFGIIGVIIYSISGNSLIAKGRTVIPSVIPNFMLVFIISTNFYLYSFWGIKTFAFSWSIGHLITGLIEYIILINNRKVIIAEIGKLAILYSLTFILISLLNLILNKFFPLVISLNSFSKILFTFIASTLSMTVLLYILNFEEKIFIKKVLYKLRLINI